SLASRGRAERSGAPEQRPVPSFRARGANMARMRLKSRLSSLSGASPHTKSDLHEYLRGARETLVWKLEGLGEYDIRRPMTPTGTNLLGLVKHQATTHISYFCKPFGRPHGLSLPWMTGDVERD